VLKEELIMVDHEIIVVDNGSNDENVEYLSRVMGECSSVSAIFNERNQGISIGKNQGINASEGDYILMLDADVVPVRNSINLMLEYMDTHEDCHALGMYPNKWSNQKNNGQKHHEDYCHKLYEPMIKKATCLYYGIYRRWMFDEGLRMNVDGIFGEVGYGWEDHDFYMLLKAHGIDQWMAHINNPTGKYYHAINSSIRVMGKNKYMETSRARGKVYNRLWD